MIVDVKIDIAKVFASKNILNSRSIFSENSLFSIARVDFSRLES